ncbi:MAG: hypothetical protein IK022_02090 [Bacteroidales bacterium]|nr:hypothetical protein [Bacteroidales bacterium]
MFPIKGPLWIWIGGLSGLATVIGYAAFAPILGIGLHRPFRLFQGP